MRLDEPVDGLAVQPGHLGHLGDGLVFVKQILKVLLFPLLDDGCLGLLEIHILGNLNEHLFLMGQNLLRQVIQVEFALARQGDHVLHDVLQLAHIARPVVLLQGKECITRNCLHLDRTELAVLAQKMVDQQGDVLAAFAQGGNRQPDDLQAVKEILPQPLLLDQHIWIAVGGADDANIDLALLDAPQPAHLVVLQYPQQLVLQVKAHLRHLVKKERPLVSGLEKPGLVDVGPGEGPLDMAEQLALEQIVGQGADSDRHKGLIPALAVIMNAPGDDLLAGAGLAVDHH
ncbi:MAG: hypothetical protein BWY77_01740 [bacterium ADurb.Bin431]|nr:MAG: hypothetical protein BWY77_01740 [bacterium ADurb.Bin431]